MDINWLGHSCFRIKGKEAIIITDPCHPSTGYSYGKVKADIVTQSHSHEGHSYINGIESGYRTITSPGEYEYKGIFITGLSTYHDGEKGKVRGKNTIFLFEIDGINLCHLGDIGHVPPSGIEEEMGEIGVLFVPVGGVSTIDSNLASEIIRNLSPRVVIPMHFKTPVVSRDLETIDKFLKKMGLKDQVTQPKLSLNKSSLPLTTQVVVLSYPQ